LTIHLSDSPEDDVLKGGIGRAKFWHPKNPLGVKNPRIFLAAIRKSAACPQKGKTSRLIESKRTLPAAT
jgi:hypothetical protein